jgi:hypothetical protein
MRQVTQLSSLSSPTLLNILRGMFANMEDERKYVRQFPLVDVLASGLAIFSLKFPSLLMFNNERNTEIIRHNLKELFQVEQAPCDTQMRRILDGVDPSQFPESFGALHRHLQGHEVFKKYYFYERQILIAIDGTEYFKSTKNHCDQCCQRTLKNGEIQYFHQALIGAIVNPDIKQVLPVAIEPILRLVDESKNNAELGALEALLRKIRKIYPTEKITILLDALYGKGPCVKLLNELDFNYIIVVKEADHVTLFSTIQNKLKSGEMTEYDEEGKAGEFFGYRYIAQVPLNKTHPDLLVNYVDCWEKSKTGKEYQCLWITDLPVTEESIYYIMRGGRARWKIENETFNTLKNQGYEFEHNYGHGDKYLSTVLVNLMLLAFLVDQIQEFGCQLFKAAYQWCHSRKVLWGGLRGYFSSYFIDGWEILWLTLAGLHKPTGRLTPDTS